MMPTFFLRFDSPDLEMRVLKLVEHLDNGRHLNMINNFTGEEKEYLLKCSNSEEGKKKSALVESSGMAKRYAKVSRKEKTKIGKEIQGAAQDDITSVCSNDLNPDPPCRKRKAPSTVYHNLAELEEMISSNTSTDPHQTRNDSRNNELVNVFGAVLSIRPAKLTKRSEWMMQLTLTDDSLPAEESTTPLNVSHIAQNIDDTSTHGTKKKIAFVTLMIFIIDYKDLPEVLRAGDILRVHRVKVQKWGDGIQLLSRRMSSFVVCRPVEATFRQYLDSSRQNVPSDSADHWQVQNLKKSPIDYSRTRELWEWAQTRLANHPSTSEEFRTNLAQMIVPDNGQSSHGDLTVMITKIISMDQNRPHYIPPGFLRVWDGSGHSESDKQPIQSLENEGLPDPPHQALSSIADIIRMRSLDDIGTEIFDPPKRLCGRVINIAIWEDSYWKLLENANCLVGTFIRLRNIRRNFGRLPTLTGDKEVFGMKIDSSVSLTPLPSYTYEVRRLLADHNARIMQNHEFNPNSGCLPLIVRKDLGRQQTLSWYRQKFPDDNTVCTLIQCMMGKEPCCFKVRFVIKKVFPSFNRENNDLKVLCFKGKDRANKASEAEVMIYQFTIGIYDATSEMNLIVSNSAGRNLIGIGSNDFLTETDTHMDPNQHHANIEGVCSRIETSVVHKGTIQSLMMNGVKYFVLDSLDSVNEVNSEKLSESLSREVRNI